MPVWTLILGFAVDGETRSIAAFTSVFHLFRYALKLRWLHHVPDHLCQRAFSIQTDIPLLDLSTRSAC